MSIVNQAELYERLWAAEKVRLEVVSGATLSNHKAEGV